MKRIKDNLSHYASIGNLRKRKYILHLIITQALCLKRI